MSSNAQCYWPDGTDAPAGFVACQPDAEISMCCNEDDMCASNGFCKWHEEPSSNHWFRGACTDRSWDSSRCTQQCLLAATDPGASAGDWNIYQCSDTTYCCANPRDIDDGSFRFPCCNDEERVFSAGAPAYLALSNFSFVASFGYPRTSTTIPTSTTAKTSSASTASSSSSPISKAKGLSPGASAGIGVGVALGILILAALAVLIVLRYRKRKQGLQHPQYVASYPEDKSALPPAWQPHNPAEAFVQPSAEGDSYGRTNVEETHTKP